MRTKYPFRWLVAVAVLACMPEPSAAQTSGEVTLEVPVQWFSATTEPTTTRRNAAGGFTIEHVVGDERGRVFYDMSMDAFGGSSGARTWLHNGGATVVFGNRRRALETGGSLFWRANEGDWGDAGFSGVSATAIGYLQPRDDVSLIGSYGFYQRNFADQPALDQLEHFFSLRFLVNLPSRTTLVASSSLGRKTYDGGEVTFGETSDAGPPHARRRAGRGFFVPTNPWGEVGEPAARTRWSWFARVAQSLADRTGVWIEVERRNTSGDMPPAIVWTPPLFYDDGVYDDPYVFDLAAWRAGMTHVWAWELEMHVWLDYGKRDFAGLSRSDRLLRAGIDGSLPVVRRAAAGLDLTASYQYVRDDSTEALESYRAHVVAAGVRIRF
jgi:hypothetical protein